MSKRKTIEERFWEKVNKDTITGCWLWTAHISKDGYGKFRSKKPQSSLAHRFSYELIKGPIPEGMVLDHYLQNTNESLCSRSCVNPDHLEITTDTINVNRSPKSLPARIINGTILGSSYGKVNGRNAGLMKRKYPLPEGVSLNKEKTKFTAQITLDKTTVYLGVFKTPKEASQAYQFARYMFPTGSTKDP